MESILRFAIALVVVLASVLHSASIAIAKDVPHGSAVVKQADRSTKAAMHHIAVAAPSGIWLIDGHGKRLRKLAAVRGARYVRRLSWSPDGETLLYQWHSAGWEIWAVGADGTNPRNLTPNPISGGGWRSPSWSPDGKRIAFMSANRPLVGLFVMNADGEQPRRVVPQGHRDVPPVWSTNGKRIAYARQAFLAHLVDADGSNDRRMLQGRAIAWLPDGQRMLCEGGGKVFLVAAMDGNRIELADGRQPQLSPDGRTVIYLNDGWLWLIGLGGNASRRLTSINDRIWDIDWSPDGGQVFVAVGQRIISVDTQTGEKLELFEAPRAKYLFLSCQPALSK